MSYLWVYTEYELYFYGFHINGIYTILQFSACSYDVMGILLDWICDAHLRYAVTDQPARPTERFSSPEYVLERVLKVKYKKDSHLLSMF